MAKSELGTNEERMKQAHEEACGRRWGTCCGHNTRDLVVPEEWAIVIPPAQKTEREVCVVHIATLAAHAVTTLPITTDHERKHGWSGWQVEHVSAERVVLGRFREWWVNA